MTQIDWRSFPEYDAKLLELAGTMTSPQIAEAMNAEYGLELNDDQVRGRFNRLRHGAKTGADSVPESTPEERFDAAVTLERSRLADQALAREMASAVKQQARWQEFLDIVEGELVRTPHEIPEFVPTFPVGSGTPEIFTLLLGDIHIGKLVSRDVVGSNFGYSAPIFLERINRLSDRVMRLFALHSSTAPFSSFRIHFLGDGVDGSDMRRGHAHRVDVQSAVQQALLLADTLEQLLRRMASLGIPVDVIWDFGNHGRIGEFGVNLPADNWDFVAGIFLERALRDVPSIRLDVQPLKYHLTQLGPYTTYSSHGDSVRGGDGFAGLPINGLARAIAKDVGLHRQLIDLYLTAHYHTAQDIRTSSGRILMNGSWDGGDDYSVNQLKAASDPVQVAFGIHPTRGITWKSEVELAPRREPTTVQQL